MDQIVHPFDAVTIFGGATLDRVARSEAAPVMGASNPGTVRRIPGGVGFNVATVLARLGRKTRLVTAVGADPDGEAILAAGTAAGVDMERAVVSHAVATAAYHAILDDGGNLIIGIADMKICEEITPAAVAAAVKATGEDFWVVDANLPPETLAFLSAEAQDARIPIAALTVSPAKAVRLKPILDSLTYLFTNRREAAALLGRDPEEAGLAVVALAQELAGTRPARVIVTNGSEPLAVSSKGEVRSHASLRAAVKGVNGAGDSFAAGVIHGLAAGHALNDAIPLRPRRRGADAGGRWHRRRAVQRGRAGRAPHRRTGAGRLVSAPPLAISAEVAAALAAKRPVVALETTIVSHGMPWPQNIETALAVEDEVRAGGALPAAIAVIDGKLRVGLDRATLEGLAKAKDVLKLSSADLAYG